jgi:DnaD/phage-associated family protein
MSNFTLHFNSANHITPVPNQFIDEYMPAANGEFVKIYLYLLRLASSGAANSSLSILQIADKFNHTEADVLRALRYWEQLGLLVLKYNQSELYDIELINTATSSNAAELCVTDSVSDKQPILEEKPSRHRYSASQLAAFKEQEEIRQLLYISERYLGRTLNATETSAILYFYDSLHFPVDLIEYLIEYCVLKNHKSIHYIESVALAWAEDGIDSVEKAKEQTVLFNKTCFSVMKAFGLNNRNPGDSEINFVKKWEQVFLPDIIIEACNRTIQAIHQPSFDYADKILLNWQKKNIRHFSDLKKLDEQHTKNSMNSKTSPNKPKTGSNTNKFNNFVQREYNFEELERKLLNKNK